MTVSRANGTARELALSSYAGLALGVVTGPLISRSLAPAGRGLLAGVLAYVGVAGLVLALGIPVAVGVKIINDRLPVGEVLFAASRLCAALTVPALLAGVLAVRFIPGLESLGTLTSVVVVLQFGVLGLSTFGNCLQTVLLARSQLRDMALLRVLPFAGNACYVLVAFILDRLTLGGLLLCNLLLGLAGVGISWRRVDTRLERGGQPGLLATGLKSVAGSAANYANLRLDQTLMLPLVSSTALGQYAVAVSVAQLPLGAAQALSSQTYGLLAGEDEVTGQERIAARQVNTTLVLAAAMAVVLALASPLIPLVYGTGYADSQVLLLLLLPGTVALSGATTAGAVAVSRGSVILTSSAEVASALVTLGGLLLLLPRLGAQGASIVSTVSYSTSLVILLFFLRRKGQLARGQLLPDAVVLGRRLLRRAAQRR